MDINLAIIDKRYNVTKICFLKKSMDYHEIRRLPKSRNDGIFLDSSPFSKAQNVGFLVFAYCHEVDSSESTSCNDSSTPIANLPQKSLML